MKNRSFLILASAIVLACVAWLVFQPASPSANLNTAVPKHIQRVPDIPPERQSAPATVAAPTSPAPTFQLRPLAVTHSTEFAEWTAEDCKDTNVIRRIAHNELEYERMVEDNARILRRQLVYRKDTAAAVLQRARLSGERVEQLTLPGLDGQEFEFAVERADLEPSKQVGTFTGHLVNRPGSIVTLAFKFGREAFTILSPEDGTYLQGHPREPGQIIVTSFDPDAYMPLPGGEPIRATEK